MLKIIISVTTCVSLCFLFVLLNITTPATAGPFGVLAIFVFAYMSSLGLMTYILYGMSRVTALISTVLVTRRPFNTLTLRRSYFFSSIAAAAPIMLIGLRSVGEVSIYEFILVIFFVIIGCLYISKRIH